MKVRKLTLLGLGHLKRNKRARQSAAFCSPELAQCEKKRDVLWPAMPRHATNIPLGCLELSMGAPIVARKYGCPH